MTRNALKTRIFSIIFIIINYLFAVQTSSIDINSDNEKNVDHYSWQLSIEDLNVVEVNTNKTISVGMTRIEVESILGKEIEIIDLGNTRFFDYGGLDIYYRNEIIAGIRVTESDRYSTNRGVKIGSSMEEFLEQYKGATPKKVYSSYEVTYFALLDGKKFVDVVNDPIWISENQDDIYVFSFLFDGESEYLYYYFIADHMFAVSMK